MTFAYKEYKVKIKMVQEQWLQLKMKFLLDFNMKIIIEWGGWGGGGGGSTFGRGSLLGEG